ncbi:MAG: gamma-glutamyl-gamma-aminobutyrate hydrolase [Gemmatales bacterium]|nr:MAG: gamma-glutamyl-gamma-aminobutyrate hydrolase [Gemmatales bacterium]
MSANSFSPHIGLYGRDQVNPKEKRGCYLWPPGYAAALEAAGGTPVELGLPKPGETWADRLSELHGILFLGHPASDSRQNAEEERLCHYCRSQHFPILAVDIGMLTLNVAFGGNNYVNLPKELPNALQHRHPPEKGLRHTIMVEANTRLAGMYGEGEIVVNSEHYGAVAKVAKGFVVSGKALDGVIEAIEWAEDDWFAVGVQWQPASSSASGLDIQLFRGLVEAATEYSQRRAVAA